MQRLIEIKLKDWKNKKNRKPLLLLGARQVGKTYLLQKFGKDEFRKTHYFDLEELKKDLLPIFNDSSLKPKEILDGLSFISGNSIDIQKDLLILDEIQSIPRAITALKYFKQNMNSLALAAAGSNLGVIHSDDAFPVGQVEILNLYPMNFEEFLLGTEEVQAIKFLKNFNGEKTGDLYHHKLFQLLKTYFVTGGMPEVVREYYDYKTEPLEAFQRVRNLQNQLLLHYGRDFSKYAGVTNSRHIERIFEAIPHQLSNTHDKQSKKFIFRDVISKGYRSYETLADPVEWLVKAGLSLKVPLHEHPSLPLLAGSVDHRFKLFLFDIGLLGAMTRLNVERIITYNYGSYKGYFAENFILQELYSYGYHEVVTWSGRTSEIEFVLELDGRLIPVEVKAGTNTKAKSLFAFINKFDPDSSIKFTGNKYGYDSQHKIYNFPLYMTSKFPELLKQK